MDSLLIFGLVLWLIKIAVLVGVVRTPASNPSGIDSADDDDELMLQRLASGGW